MPGAGRGELGGPFSFWSNVGPGWHGWLANADFFAGSSGEAHAMDGMARRFTWAFTLGNADGGSETYFLNAHMTS